MKKLLNLFKIALLSMLVFTVSCKKYLDSNISKSVITDDTQWASEGNADLFLNGIYGQLYQTVNSPDPLDSFTEDNDGGIYWTSWHWKAANVGANTDGGTPF